MKDYLTEKDACRFVNMEELLKEFFLFPMALFQDEKLRGLSNPSKLLYALMLSRLNMNAHEDEDGRRYITYTLREISQDLNCTFPTAMHYVEELEQWKLIGRSERVNGVASKIFLCSDFLVKESEK